MGSRSVILLCSVIPSIRLIKQTSGNSLYYGLQIWQTCFQGLSRKGKCPAQGHMPPLNSWLLNAYSPKTVKTVKFDMHVPRNSTDWTLEIVLKRGHGQDHMAL